MRRHAARFWANFLGAALLAGAVDAQADAGAGCTVRDPDICGLEWDHRGADLGQRDGIGMLQVEMHPGGREELLAGGLARGDLSSHAAARPERWKDPPPTGTGSQPPLDLATTASGGEVLPPLARLSVLAGAFARERMAALEVGQRFTKEKIDAALESIGSFAAIAGTLLAMLALLVCICLIALVFSQGTFDEDKDTPRAGVIYKEASREVAVAPANPARQQHERFVSQTSSCSRAADFVSPNSSFSLAAEQAAVAPASQLSIPPASAPASSPSLWAYLDPVTEGAPGPSHPGLSSPSWPRAPPQTSSDAGNVISQVGQPKGALDALLEHWSSVDSQQAEPFALDGALPGVRNTRDAKLSDNLVVPEEHDAVLMVPSLRQLPPPKATAPFDITDAMGNAVLGVLFSRDPPSGDSDHAVEQVTLRTRDERTIAFCNILVPQRSDQARWSQCKVHRWSGEMFGCLEPAAGPGVGGTKPALVFTANDDASRLFFYVDPVSGGLVASDEGSNQVVTVERKREDQSQELSLARLAPKADAALILCCIMAIDRMLPDD